MSHLPSIFSNVRCEQNFFFFFNKLERWDTHRKDFCRIGRAIRVINFLARFFICFFFRLRVFFSIFQIISIGLQKKIGFKYTLGKLSLSEAHGKIDDENKEREREREKEVNVLGLNRD